MESTGIGGITGMNYNDTKFITNETGNLLSTRLQKLLQGTKYFDVLVGYFRLSGFKQIYDHMDNAEKIRILIGINTEQTVLDIVTKSKEYIDVKDNATKNLLNEIENSNDTLETEESIELFTRLVQEGKIEIRGYDDRNIHAKLYICKYPEDGPFPGAVITGSSNLSYSGTEGNIEFNVELRDGPDLAFASNKFNELWEKSTELSETFVEKVKKDTWLNNDLTPYEIYLKTIYEYYKDIVEEEGKVLLETGKKYNNYSYQTDAVALAYSKLEEYGGVFISDVVGLGKTYITGMLLKRLNKRTLILSPPQLMHNWKEVKQDLKINCDIESQGKIEDVELEMIDDYYDVIVIDEAHKFRNSKTKAYSSLHKICKGKKVILVTATPRNNYNTDIEALLYLFQDKHDSNILSDSKFLGEYFKGLRKELNGLQKNSKEYKDTNRYISGRIRDDILSKVMIRRTRTDITKIYAEDMEKQGLKFPEVETPEPLYYTLKGESKEVYAETLRMFSELDFAIYQPMNYYTGKGYEQHKGRHVGVRGFMRTMFIKRLESSFYAFTKTINNIIKNHERFIDLYNSKGCVSLMSGKELDKMLEAHGDDIDLEELIDNTEDLIGIEGFSPELIGKVESDYLRFLEVQKLWENIKEDHKWDYFSNYINNDDKLKSKKLIIFTEYKDTAQYISKKIDSMGIDNICYTGSSTGKDKNLVRACFDKGYTNKQNLRTDINILVATDVLAEGVNLNKSDTVINYDIPWNPIKVIQRVGRINRVDTDFEKLYIYNLFPTEESEKVTNMTEIIVSKLQAFHDILGEDAKYLSELEEVESKELHGDINDESVQTVYGALSGENLKDDNVGITSLAKDSLYIRELKDIKENDPDLYKHISKIPKKSRTAKLGDVQEDTLITFIRQGKRKKFFKSGGDSQVELRPEEALELIYSTKDTNRDIINEDYFDKLKSNKTAYQRTSREGTVMTDPRSNNEKQALKFIRTVSRSPKTSPEDREKLQDIEDLVKAGALSYAEVDSINKLGKKEDLVGEILKVVGSSYINYRKKKDKEAQEDYEVVLSMYLKKE